MEHAVRMDDAAGIGQSTPIPAGRYLAPRSDRWLRTAPLVLAFAFSTWTWLHAPAGRTTGWSIGLIVASGTLLAAVALGVWLGWVGPCTVVDKRGIRRTFLRLSRTIPWSDIAGFHVERSAGRERVEVQLHSRQMFRLVGVPVSVLPTFPAKPGVIGLIRDPPASADQGVIAGDPWRPPA